MYQFPADSCQHRFPSPGSSRESRQASGSKAGWEGRVPPSLVAQCMQDQAALLDREARSSRM